MNMYYNAMLYAVGFRANEFRETYVNKNTAITSERSHAERERAILAFRASLEKPQAQSRGRAKFRIREFLGMAKIKSETAPKCCDTF